MESYSTFSNIKKNPPPNLHLFSKGKKIHFNVSVSPYFILSTVVLANVDEGWRPQEEFDL